MIRRVTCLLLALLAWPTVWRASAAKADIVEYHDELACGDAQFRLVTRLLNDTPVGNWEFLGQSLWLTNNVRGISTLVPLGLSFVPHFLILGHRVLDNTVTEWACIRANSGQHYLLLLYACRPLSSDCPLALGSEWDRILDVAGRFVAGGRRGESLRVLRRLRLEAASRSAIFKPIGPFRQ
jgi:hypothetical protein